MIYKSEIETDENKKVKKCPRCDNEEILDGDYCQICGLELYNRCTNFEEDDYGNFVQGCGEICSSNARYCHRCGHKTSFYQLGLLPDYNQEKNNNDFVISNGDDLPF